VRFTQVSAAYGHALALSSDGAVYEWGVSGFSAAHGSKQALEPTRVQTPLAVRFKAIAAGDDVNAALTTSGDVYTWGQNYAGQLGNGKKSKAYSTPPIKPVKVKRPKGVRFTAIAVGYKHVLALASNGAVYAWGGNDHGQLGDGTKKDRSQPVKVKLPKGFTAARISTTEYATSFAVAKNGTAYAWGSNSSAEHGSGKIDPFRSDYSIRAHTRPVKMAPPKGVNYTSVAQGSYLATGSDGGVYAWGRNDSGNLGIGTWDKYDCGMCRVDFHTSPVKVLLPKSAKIKQIESSTDNRYALTTNGTLYAWGNGYNGLNGDGSRKRQTKPVKVKLPKNVKVKQVSASTNYVLAVGSNGKIYAWGTNVFGTFANGKVAKPSAKPRVKPIAVKSPALAKLSATPTPRITGSAQVGKVLKAVPGTWKPAGVKRTYQWFRNGKKIPNATTSTYRLTSQDRGKKITVKVSGKAPGHAQVTKTSFTVTVRR
jgi:alpha-tubulin suppressor-like RCC1 family protein